MHTTGSLTNAMIISNIIPTAPPITLPISIQSGANKMSSFRDSPSWVAIPDVNGKNGPTSGHCVLASVTLIY